MQEEMWRDLERNTIDLINKYAEKGARILDVGVGTGRLLAQFTSMNRYGIDVALGYLERLGDSGIECSLGVVEDLPYQNNVFDIVVCTDVLEHVFDLHKAISELYRVLKPEGMLIIRVPYKENLELYLHKDYPYHIAHVRNFDEHELEIQFSRVFDFRLCETLYDKAFVPVSLALPLPRGKIFLTKLLVRLQAIFPFLKNPLQRLYKPTEISMAFKKPA
ncbi:MAG: class I SAM-dependent methyltransferase [Sedimenticola selenatireducens]|uniref:Class I SAM-dependent methyltransferase n=2 Tax=Sedimenticola selenatireducens TaxID=191960 RepID=A0A558DUU0_9GAMM|nr:class I SAM-dependent methyltransferase [Sedimenticola selenatireducens]TVT64811.1 MAG: class I SAM-dependent methyltransferase [Sedimenticola selenatireducens]